MEKILVNCALPYANSPLHLGHIAGSNLGADIFVRALRLTGYDVLYVCGSDEYGTPITIQAEAENVSPKDIADRYHQQHEKSLAAMQINFDIFSRTTSPIHHETASELFRQLYNNGYLERTTMISPFCPTCGKFMPDRYIEGTCPYCGNKRARGDQCDECGRILDPRDLIDPRCIISGDAPEFRETDHLFFRLDKFQDKLESWINSRTNWKPHVLEFTKGLLAAGLKPRPATRDMSWGIPVPITGFENKVIYVWIEALMGYLSFAKELSLQRGKKDLWKDYWQDPNVKAYYFMGKDNITFHTIIWPAIIMGVGGLNLPYDVPANEYLQFNGEKFSKSRGIGFSIDSITSKVDSNYVRYYLASILPENGDSNFSLEEMQEKVNSEFISKYGNLLHRIVSFVVSNKIELSSRSIDPEDHDILDSFLAKFDEYTETIKSVEIKKALKLWIDQVQEANSYVNRSEPWKLIKSDLKKCEGKLYTALRMLQILTVMIYPYTPEAAEKALRISGFAGDIKQAYETLRREDVVFAPSKAEVPFQRLELKEVNPNSLDLTVGLIEKVEEHPDADRLYVLQVFLGDRRIQLVAGLRKHYTPDQLAGRRIIVVANLKKGRFRGKESQGMLLAADDGNSTKILTVDDSVSPGTKVEIGPYRFNGTHTVEIEDLQKMGLKVGENQKVFAVLDGSKEFLHIGPLVVHPESKVLEGATVK